MGNRYLYSFRQRLKRRHTVRISLGVSFASLVAITLSAFPGRQLWAEVMVLAACGPKSDGSSAGHVTMAGRAASDISSQIIATERVSTVRLARYVRILRFQVAIKG